MPMHDWTRVEAGIFHAFHHNWITAISAVLNGGLLPPEYYALPEQQAAGFGPDIVALQVAPQGAPTMTIATKAIAKPKTTYMAESSGEFYRRKKSSVVIRHVSGDRIVAVVEIVSPGNKSGLHAFKAFAEKACDLLESRIHLLIVDPFPPGRRDPQGIHAAIWAETADDTFELPKGRPLTLAAYECGLQTRAYVETIAVGDILPGMPLFLDAEPHIDVPLEATYETAFNGMPQRWREVLTAPK